MEQLFLILVILCVFVYYYKYYKIATYVKSHVDNKYYLVRRLDDQQIAADILATIRKNITQVAEEAKRRFDKSDNTTYQNYINVLVNRIKNIRIIENINNHEYTSYSVEKGEELVFCLRSRNNIDHLHDINILMYVVLHEIAHIACPEYGHTPLFKQIFTELTKIAIDINIYKKIDFKTYPEEYCGMQITDSVV